jgi:ABC-type branched-subunit amino acid transport system substrate-binding protein
MSERRYSRRQLLRLAGGSAGVAVGAPLLRVDGAWAREAALKVGVLTPSGSHYPRMGENLLAGLELGLDRDDAPAASLVVRQVEAGYVGAHSAARELLDSGADVVVAGVSAPVAQQLEPMFRERRRTLLVSNVGAHVVRPEERSAHVVYNSLLDWQAAYSIGAWAARGGAGKRALVLTSLSDAGYDNIYGFRCGLGTAGGRVAETLVTHAGETESLLARLRALPGPHPTVTYVAASGVEAAKIVRAYRSSGLGAPLLASAFAVEDYMLPSLGANARGVRSCASWAKAVGGREFDATFRRRTGHRPDGFAVLGYETALLLAAGWRRSRGHPERVGAALAGHRVAGLRGTLTVDPRTNVVLAPLYRRKVRNGRNMIVGKASSVGAFPPALHPIADATTSAYINEYLCA